MGAAHQWANAPNRGLFILTAPGAHSLSAVVNWHAGAWSKVWKANKPEVVDDTLTKVSEFLTEVRNATDASRQLLELITVARLRVLLPTFHKNTPLGADGVRMSELAAASDECLEHLCEILRAAVIKVSLPIQSMLTKTNGK